MTSTDPGFRARHGFLARGYRGAVDPEDPADVLAMQMVLHIPKQRPVDRFDLLAAAASSVVSLCLDERVGEGGEWHDDFVAWMDARIRKVARRARGAQWEAVQDVPGVTVEVGDAQARAFVPGRVVGVDPRVKKVQIGGTELPPGTTRSVVSPHPVLWIDPRLEMTVGKSAAQVGHASMLLAAALPFDTVAQWAGAGYPVVVAEADAEQWDRLCRAVDDGRAVAVHDAGFTEVAPGARTVIAQWDQTQWDQSEWDQTHRGQA
ncbi:aminoacyl-tRNA hydrolase [Smaragdicoccus niigatensis]|uniref:aminoacyl-tRNA hydrolase n=1 Tax=Smaragdicoccus niigatensis TaxID=359359 RepID=UPI0003A24326|nr:aminoacyl-tRNA hydrolase [Smaragdicoccus niigatensis]